VTSHGHVLAHRGRNVSIYDSDANLVSTCTLPSEMKYLTQVVETSSGTFIISHRGENDRLNYISEVTMNGDVIRSYDAPRGKKRYQVNDPMHVAIDDEDNIYVVDCSNDRVLILNSTLRLRRIIEYSAAGLRGSPGRLCYSKDTRQLIVGVLFGHVDVWNISHE